MACSTPNTAPGDGHDEANEEGHGRRFEDPEAWAEQWNSPERDEWQRPAEVVELMDIEPGMRVLDLGAGTGYFVPHLAEAVGPEGTVIAADVEPRMVEYVREKSAEQGLTNVETQLVPADEPGLQPESADRVLIVNTWHHIEDREVYAQKLAEGLRPGGVVAVVDYTLDARGGPPLAMRLNPDVVVAELEAGGFDAAIVEEGLPLQYVVIARKR